MDKKVKAIVTRAVPYREADLILTLVSLEEGKLTASAKSCLKPGAKLRYAAAPMNFGEYMLSGKGDRYIVTDCVQYDSFSPITADIDKYYAACLILEMLAMLSPEAQPSLFLHSVNELKAMAYENKAAADAVCDFLLHTLNDNGAGLDFSACSACRCILDGDASYSESDGVVCPHCASFDGIKIDAVSRAFLAGENREIPDSLKNRANIMLADFVYRTLGVRPDGSYFKEQK